MIIRDKIIYIIIYKDIIFYIYIILYLSYLSSDIMSESEEEEEIKTVSLLDIGSRISQNDLRTSENSLLDIGSRISNNEIDNVNNDTQLIIESDKENLTETNLLGIGSRLSENALDNNNSNNNVNDDVELSTRSQQFMSLSQITKELNEILNAANNNEKYDEDRLNELIIAQKENPEYQAQIEEEHRRWRSTVDDFLIQSVLKMRSFVPPSIHCASLESLAEFGLSSDISKRLLNKKCLWLIRMSSEEISRLHEADLYGRYNTSGQLLDIIETAAIYCSLPETFLNDHSGKKKEWANLLEENLKQMISEQEKNNLPKGKLRSPIYKDDDNGPITDLDTLKDFEFVTSRNQRKSFTDVCKRHSIFHFRENMDENKHET